MIPALHAQVMNVLLGVLDDGRLTDSKGRTVSFANTVIIMTSNLGSDLLLEHGNTPLARELVSGVVKQHFRPEFLNRLDDVVMFEPLGHEHLRAVARLQVRFRFSPATLLPSFPPSPSGHCPPLHGASSTLLPSFPPSPSAHCPPFTAANMRSGFRAQCNHAASCLHDVQPFLWQESALRVCRDERTCSADPLPPACAQVKELNARLMHKGISLELTEAALDYAVGQSYDHMYGARPLRRWLEHHILTDLSRMIVGGQLPDGSHVVADTAAGSDSEKDGGGLKYDVQKGPERAEEDANGVEAKRARWEGVVEEPLDSEMEE